MPDLKYEMTHNDTIKWRNGDISYCLLVQRDDDMDNPIAEDEVVKIACFGARSNIGNDETTKGKYPGEYWVQLCRNHADPEDALQKIRDGKIAHITATPDKPGLVSLFDKKSGDSFEAVPIASIIDILADNLTIGDCKTILEDILFAYPIWAYEHSGMTVTCGGSNPYNDQWDSFQIGEGIVLKQTVLDNWPNEADNWKEKAKEIIVDAVKSLDMYLNDETYGYFLYSLNANDKTTNASGEPDWNEEDSVWGFLGSDIIASGIAESVDRGLLDAIKSMEYTAGEAKQVHTVTTLLGTPR